MKMTRPAGARTLPVGGVYWHFSARLTLRLRPRWEAKSLTQTLRGRYRLSVACIISECKVGLVGVCSRKTHSVKCVWVLRERACLCGNPGFLA